MVISVCFLCKRKNFISISGFILINSIFIMFLFHCAVVYAIIFNFWKELLLSSYVMGIIFGMWTKDSKLSFRPSEITRIV